jgi:hypothetical protein
MRSRILTIPLLAIAAVAARPVLAASDCITITPQSPSTLCEGKLGEIRVDVENACSVSKKIVLSFAVDGQPLHARGVAVVPADATMAKNVLFMVPSDLTPGTHVVTVTATDASGSTTPTDIRVDVDTCASR